MRVERDVVALRRAPARHGLGDEIADLVWTKGIGHVDDPKPAAEPDGMHDRARHPFAELMRAEASAARAAEGRIDVSDLEFAERLVAGASTGVRLPRACRVQQDVRCRAFYLVILTSPSSCC